MKEKGIVLCVDWNNLNKLIVSGSEDCCYRVFDENGNFLHESSSLRCVVTCVSWQPRGCNFTIGSHGHLHLCDESGFIHDQIQLEIGSIFKISWSSDAMQFACSCEDGSVILSDLVGDITYRGDLTFYQKGSHQIEVRRSGERDVQLLDFPA